MSGKKKKKIPRYIADTDDKNVLQRYFEEVGKIYEDNDNEFDIEYCEENRDKLLKMNLKCVIKTAKGYRGRGLSLEELISAGNEGLCIAWDKYNPKRNNNPVPIHLKIPDGKGNRIDIQGQPYSGKSHMIHFFFLRSGFYQAFNFLDDGQGTVIGIQLLFQTFIDIRCRHRLQHDRCGKRVTP